MDFKAAIYLLITYCAFVKYLRKMETHRSSLSANFRLQ